MIQEYMHNIYIYIYIYIYICIYIRLLQAVGLDLGFRFRFCKNNVHFYSLSVLFIYSFICLLFIFSLVFAVFDNSEKNKQIL